MARKKAEKKIIGRIEYIDLPDFGMEGIEAKVDTGAYRSALHCHAIQEYSKGEKNVLYFKLLDPSHPLYNEQQLSFKEYSESRVKSSSGQVEVRYKIKTRVKLGKKIYTTEFTLTNRSDMKYPVLLGRKVLTKRFLVDVSKKNLLTNIKEEK